MDEPKKPSEKYRALKEFWVELRFGLWLLGAIFMIGKIVPVAIQILEACGIVRP